MRRDGAATDIRAPMVFGLDWRYPQQSSDRLALHCRRIWRSRLGGARRCHANDSDGVL